MLVARQAAIRLDVRQVVRSDVVDRFAQFGAVLGVLENFGPNIGQPQAAGRTFEQADPELILKVGNAAADGRGRHLQTARASEKPFASTTLAKIIREFSRSSLSSRSYRSPLSDRAIPGDACREAHCKLIEKCITE